MKKWMILCLAALLAGCSSESKAAEQTASSGSQGCDIFEQCGTEASPSAEGTSFKEAYEALNGTERGEHTVRSVEIPENNPFQEITGDEAAALLDQDGEFYLYIGDEACPWCRSVMAMKCCGMRTSWMMMEIRFRKQPEPRLIRRCSLHSGIRSANIR